MFNCFGCWSRCLHVTVMQRVSASSSFRLVHIGYAFARPASVHMHPFCMCKHAHTSATGPRPALGTQTHFTFLSEVSHLFSGLQRASQRRRGRGISQTNTKGYSTHSTLNIKDSSNYSTPLSSFSCVVSYAIYLTLGMAENG